LQLLHRTCHDQKSARDGSATRRRQQGVHAKNRVTEEPNAEKLARSVCAVRSFVVSPTQSGGTGRCVPGSPGLPGRESARGQEHARKAVAVRRRPGWRAARPAIWPRLDCLKPNLQW
jgi:hypothetical protein